MKIKSGFTISAAVLFLVLSFALISLPVSGNETGSPADSELSKGRLVSVPERYHIRQDPMEPPPFKLIIGPDGQIELAPEMQRLLANLGLTPDFLNVFYKYNHGEETVIFQGKSVTGEELEWVFVLQDNGQWIDSLTGIPMSEEMRYLLYVMQILPKAFPRTPGYSPYLDRFLNAPDMDAGSFSASPVSVQTTDAIARGAFLDSRNDVARFSIREFSRTSLSETQSAGKIMDREPFRRRYSIPSLHSYTH